MQRFYPLLFLIPLACSPSTKNETDQDQTSGENKSFGSISLDDLQGEWQELTEREDGSLYIFKPCDADNMMMRVSSDTLMIGWGQDATLALIKSFYVDEAGRLVLSVHDQDENIMRTYYMQWEHDTDPLTRWYFWDLDESPVLMAHEDIADNYMVYQQPCSECWDDCEDE